MAGWLRVEYRWDDPYGESGVRFVAWREGTDLTPDKVLPRLFGWFLPKPRQDRVEELEARVLQLERLFGPGSYDSEIERITHGAFRNVSPWR